MHLVCIEELAVGVVDVAPPCGHVGAVERRCDIHVYVDVVALRLRLGIRGTGLVVLLRLPKRPCLDVAMARCVWPGGGGCLP
jgi:hypothetical protein